MAEPETKRKRIRKIKFFWMAEPGHPHEVGVLHNRHPAAGTHKPLRKDFENKRECVQTRFNAYAEKILILLI
jgi:hypothetical protein